MSFFKFQVIDNSTSMDSHTSPTTSLQTVNTTPGPASSGSANPSTQIMHPIPVTPPSPINASQHTVLRTTVAGQRITQDSERLKSGTTQPDTEFTQALHAWIVQLDTVEQEKSATKNTMNDMTRETLEAERCRENLLKPQGQKKKRDERDVKEEEEMEVGSTNQRRKKKLQRSFGEELREKEIEAMHKDTALLVSAVQDMGTQMAGAIRYLGSNNSSDTTNNTDVTRLQDHLCSLEKQGEEQKEQGRWEEDMLNKAFGELSC
ncbi:hypothetical protein L873DRAFT_1841620 [Choiromyces venosus 120613-1]|uniref:Uncharacterized protein n=1 Tax=Choiromyces venosus 120613-1 TaxID=1336337 RepID=A0A3N4JWN0_9PEZI|nr:hypothetical protein L873DRAFT_1841620 [Choiromyces venosus 120613-1]